MNRPGRVLVTGAAGRLGTEVLLLLAAQGIDATALDRRPPGARADRTVIAEATDVGAVERALDRVDAVIHCAALASPTLGTAIELFHTNTVSTFTVLEAASRLGVGRMTIASSFSVTGMPRGPGIRPVYLPIDEDHPLQVADVYALSKQVDEASARMIVHSSGTTVVAIRYPLLGSPERELSRDAARIVADPAAGVGDLWSYLDTRDAARAALLAITADISGYHCVFVAAPNTLSSTPTESLLAEYLPDVPRRSDLAGTAVPIDTTRATQLLGFVPEHVFGQLTSADQRE